MSQIPPDEMQRHLPGYDVPAGELGVMDAVRMGWRLLMSDFWQVWLVGLVFLALLTAAGFVPFGQLIAGPPLMAGLLYVLTGRVDGRRPPMGEMFEGFRQRFSQSIVSLLPVFIAYMVFGIVWLALYFSFFFPMFIAAERSKQPVPEQLMAMWGGVFVAITLVHLAMMIFQMFFMFAPLAVWKHPESGWEAAKESVRLVRDHFWSTLGFVLLFWLISFVANLLGMLTCCVGMFFTTPLVLVWAGGALVYLYRSWTGRPLVQPVAEAPPEPAPPESASSTIAQGSPFPPRDAMPPTPPDLTGGQGPGE